MDSQILSDRYKIQRELGKKAGRRTLLAWDLQTQQLVIVKILSFSSDFEWDDLKLFEREAETLKSLSHPAIPQYLDYLEWETPNSKGFALVQTYIEAKSLEEHLKAGRTFSEAEIVEIAMALLEILNYLHTRTPPVIHRDIKPSNLLLSNRSGHSVGQIYLVDFGSVQTLAAQEGGTITVVGTYGYMPPEQFGGRAVPASDLYSLGATLIYLVTGLHPADLPQLDLKLQFEPLTNLSPEFTWWLNKMIEPSVNRRFVSASTALQDLKNPPNLSIDASLTPTLIEQRPQGSKILLVKDKDTLEIIIPPKRFRLGWGVLAIFWNALVLISILGFLSTSFSVNQTVLLLVLWGFAIPTNWKILMTLWGRTRIYLDRDRLQISYQLFGWKYHLHPVSRSDISKILYSNRYYRAPRGLESAPQGYVLDETRLILWVGTQKYELCTEKAVSSPEIEWLACELSHWLGLPVQRE